MTTSSPHSQPLLSSAPIGKITQGTIFSCAHAERYKETSAFGLAITARCDIAQNKYRILNYVPIVPLEQWLLIDGLDAILPPERHLLKEQLKSSMEEAGISPNLLMSISLDDIAKAHFSIGDKSKKIPDLTKRFLATKELIQTLEAAESAGEKETLQWFKKNKPKKISEIIKRLSKNDVSGYYFLSYIEDDAQKSGYVCLLREITTLSKGIVDEISNGLTKSRWTDVFKEKNASSLNFSTFDFSMPISQINSPFIEHIMQSFSILFGRIGLPDHPTNIIDKIIIDNTDHKATQS